MSSARLGQLDEFNAAQLVPLLASVLAVNDVDALRAMLQEVVHGYQPAEEIADLVYRESEFPAHAAEQG